MKRLAYFLENPFDDAAISVAELLAFTTDHLQRMIANNDSGQLTAHITATTSAYQEVGDCVSDDGTKLGLRMARNQVKTDFRKDTLRAGVARIEGALKGAYADSAGVLVEALPKGRTIFTACRDDQVATYIAILHGVVTARAADLPPAIVTLAGTLKTQWTAILSACEESTGRKVSTENGKKLARQNLQLMLFLNLHKLAEMFPRQPEKLSLYMQQHLLKNRSRREDEEPVPEPTV